MTKKEKRKMEMSSSGFWEMGHIGVIRKGPKDD